MDWSSFLLPAAGLAATALTAGAAAPAVAGMEGGVLAGGTGAALDASLAAGTANAAGAMPGALSSGLTGAANPAIEAGMMAGSAPVAPPMGMLSVPGQTGAPALGTGLSGTGTFAEIPQAGAAATMGGAPAVVKPGLNTQQLAQLAKLAGGDQGQAHPSIGASGGAGAQSPNRVTPMATVSAPGVGQRASLAQLLYGRH